MPKSQWLITFAFATCVFLTDQIHRLLSLSSPSMQKHSRHTDFEFLPLELIRAMNQTENRTTSNDKSNNSRIRYDNKPKFPWSLPPTPLHQKSSKQFMSEINALKRSRNIALPWETSSPLPFPIISYNLPKSATLTTKEFFACGDVVSSHTFVPFSQTRIGDCMRDNFVNNSDPFQGCDYHPKLKKTIEFYSDIGIQLGRSGRSCWYSSIHDEGLEHVATFYPNATIFMVPRNATSWYKSVSKWGNGRLFHGWIRRCGFMGPSRHQKNYTQTEWENFYIAHTEKIRQFALKNLHMTYVEVDLEAADSAETMEYYTGIDKSCLQHCRPGKPEDPNTDLRTYQKCKSIEAQSS